MSGARAPRRFPRGVFGQGSEPDPRFTLANERTFLAWLRTSLALLAAGVALEAFSLPLQPQLRLAASLVLIGLGILVPVQAWVGWARDERAMRRAEALAAPFMTAPLAAGVVVAGVLVALAVVLR